MDECGFSPSQSVNYSWTVSGKRKSIPYENPQRLRINVMAAMIAHGNSGALVRSKESSAREVKRALALLKDDESISDPKISEALSISVPTVARLGKRFVVEGMENALSERPRRDFQAIDTGHPASDRRRTGTSETL